MESAINNGMCRCCASEGTFKDLKSAYQWMGDEEVYSEMLRECFDITLFTNIEGEVEGGICEVCVTQLRNASNFKKQVLQTEEQFKLRLQDKLFKNDIVKVEAQPDSDNDSDNDHASEDYSEYEVPIKLESDEPKPKKRGAKASTSRAKRTKTDDGETSKPRLQKAKRGRLILKEDKLKRHKPDKVKKPALKTEKRRLKKIILRKPEEKKITIHLKRVSELDRHLDNIRMILLCSNATPIRCHAGVGYKCCFCSDQYAKPSDLKEHTLSKHDDETKSSFMKRATMVRYIVKLDISWLACKLCGGNMKTLEDLISHLVSKHEKVYYSDIKNHIIPFKFESEGLKCAVCCNDFNNFKVLLEHMNVHFKNHVCEVCGCGFVNKHTLQCHSYRHITGVFNCSHCPKVFDTKVKRRDHERSVHVKASKTNKCGYCDEKFSDYRKKKDHEVKEHGATPLVLKCQACDETFNDQTLLTVHTKTYHLMERRIPH